jgi:hypothetical protein
LPDLPAKTILFGAPGNGMIMKLYKEPLKMLSLGAVMLRRFRQTHRELGSA